MIFASKRLYEAFKLLFPPGRFRYLLVGLVLLAAIISLTEMLVAKLFSTIVLESHKGDTHAFIKNSILFFAVFLITRTAHFVQKVYRVSVFDKAFLSSETKVARLADSWRWALAFELTSVLTLLTQLIVISLYFVYMNPLMGLMNLTFSLLVMQCLGFLFKRQLASQLGFVEKKKNREHVETSVRVASRIRSGEIGALIAGIGMLFVLAALLVLSYKNVITASNTIVFFFGIRMLNHSLQSISSGLMRFARASANSDE